MVAPAPSGAAPATENSTAVPEVHNADHSMVLVPEGLFVMGWEAGDSDEQPPHQVFLSAYLH